MKPMIPKAKSMKPQYDLLRVMAELRGLGGGAVVMSQQLAQDTMSELERLQDLDDILIPASEASSDEELLEMLRDIVAKYRM